MAKKIALCGSSPSSVLLAPFDDPEWEIWGCSPGLFPVAKRTNLWFELHRWEPPIIGVADKQVPWFSPEYVQWMAQRKHPVWMVDHVQEIPESKAFPYKMLLEKHGPYFFNSSLSWMAAWALEDPEVTDIGFWGVDMSALEEYKDQRLGCQYFILEAMKRGIRITVPKESDLVMPRPLYAIGESTPFAIKNLARQKELTARLNAAQARLQQAQHEATFLQGALDDCKYHNDTWAGTELLNNLEERDLTTAKVITLKRNAGD